MYKVVSYMPLFAETKKKSEEKLTITKNRKREMKRLFRKIRSFIEKSIIKYKNNEKRRFKETSS